MNSLRQFLGEPLLHFLLIGVAVFMLYSATNSTVDQPPQEVVQVSPGRIGQLVEVFSRTWQRPPTRDELEGLVESFIKEEIYYREGRKLGLDLDDTVFRRRLQQKMEFLIEPDETALVPAKGELETFLAENASKFAVDERVEFEQIYFDTAKRGNDTNKAAEAVLASLNSPGARVDPAQFGDPTVLPGKIKLAPARQIENNFGKRFADELVKLPTGRWAGPIPSEFGLHVVKIDKLEPAYEPELADIREIVLREWRDGKRKEIANERYRALRDKYKIVVDWPDNEKLALGSGENR
jgi:PPIC-type PPIASE domain